MKSSYIIVPIEIAVIIAGCWFSYHRGFSSGSSKILLECPSVITRKYPYKVSVQTSDMRFHYATWGGSITNYGATEWSDPMPLSVKVGDSIIIREAWHMIGDSISN